MLVKGIIINQIAKTIDNNHLITNRYNVRIPTFEAQGSNTQAIIECGLCYQPGNNLGYYPGDIVLVDFEQDLLNAGFILGKLYTSESSSKNVSEANPAILKVTSTAELPANTKIEGVKIIDEIKNLKIKVNNLINNVETASESESESTPGLIDYATINDLEQIFN